MIPFCIAFLNDRIIEMKDRLVVPGIREGMGGRRVWL